ncbi:MAG: hypothetical protein WCD34_17665, partial [Candidatus Acidiferrum sp.]
MSQRKHRISMMTLFILLGLAPLCLAQSQDDVKQQSHDIFKQLVEINTTDSVGNVTTATEALAKRL